MIRQMTVRRRKLALDAAAAALWAGAAGVVAAGVYLPVEVPVPTVARGATRPTTATAATEPFDFGDLADLDLRPPLAAEATPAAAAVVMRLPLGLKGTVVEPGHAYAVFAGPNGETQLRRVGERTGEATVESIGDGTATLRAGGRQIVMRVSRAAPPEWAR